MRARSASEPRSAQIADWRRRRRPRDLRFDRRLAVDAAKLPADCAVFDIIAARRTEFMQACVVRGLKVVDGVAMIKHQLPLRTALWRGEA